MHKGQMDETSAGRALPRFAGRIIEGMNGAVAGEAVAGDFEEEYRDIHRENGPFRARVWLAAQLAWMIWGKGWNRVYWHSGMLKAYTRTAARTAAREKMYTLVNLSGLTLGLVCCILISLWIVRELSYDRFHEESGTLYHVLTNRLDQNGISVSPVPLGPILEEEFPDVVASSRYHWLFQPPVVRGGEMTFKESKVRFVDPAFLRIFSFPLVSGDRETALDAVGAIVITEDVAARYFPGEDPMGKTLILNGEHPFTVTGVLENIPSNSTLGFEILAHIDFRIANTGDWYTTWDNLFAMTFIKLADGADPRVLEANTASLIGSRGGDEGASLTLLPFTGRYMHFISDRNYIYIFAAVAFLVLAMACLNYMNLATARAAGRAREIALRKTIGAFRGDLIIQLLAESLLLSLVAGAASILVASALLPLFNQLAGSEIILDPGLVIPAVAMLSVVTGLLGGIYPALLLSSYRPVRIFRSRTGSGMRNPVLRKTLVVFQFAVTIVLMTAVTVIHRQLGFLHEAPIGYDRERVVSIQLGGGTAESYQFFKEQLLTSSEIKGVTGTGAPLPFVDWQLSGLRWEGLDPDTHVMINYNDVDYDFVETMGMEIVQGRDFSPEYSDGNGARYLVNEKMAALMGTTPVVGASLDNGNERGEVVGVIKDFHYSSLANEIGPQVLKLEPGLIDNMLIRIGEGSDEALVHIGDKWEELFPGNPFAYTFIDDDYHSGYTGVERRGRLLDTFAILAALIAALGLFGLASYTATQRTKEIGIRKVLGASTSGILVMLTREFSLCLVLSAAIACPAGYILMQRWLGQFAYRASMDILVFAVPLAAAAAVSVLGVSYQSARVAIANPVKSLRYE